MPGAGHGRPHRPPRPRQLPQQPRLTNITDKIIEHKITLEVVPDLMDQDLKDLGMITIGRRRRFQVAGGYLGLVLPTVEERVV